MTTADESRIRLALIVHLTNAIEQEGDAIGRMGWMPGDLEESMADACLAVLRAVKGTNDYRDENAEDCVPEGMELVPASRERV